MPRSTGAAMMGVAGKIASFVQSNGPFTTLPEGQAVQMNVMCLN